MVTLPLSRTCNLRDFPGCVTVAAWQQRLAEAAWAHWVATHHRRTRTGGLVVNYSGVDFLAPGPHATYWHGGDGMHMHTSMLHGLPDGLQNGDRVPAIYGLCVLDRIEAPVAFVTQAASRLGPRGLLFLTFAYWDAEGEDLAAGREERRRIYSVHSALRLIRDARKVGFENFGGTDWAYHGDVLEDHSLASLVFIKREREET